jgi:hypothetical protein
VHPHAAEPKPSTIAVLVDGLMPFCHRTRSAAIVAAEGVAMRRRSRGSVELVELPVQLRHVIRAAERECPRGHANALRDLTALAVRKVPARVIFDPTSRGEEDLFMAIETVANRHLGRTRARGVWRTAVRRGRLDLEARDRIERAALEVQGVSDTAHFYAGLAFGLTWVSVYRDR